MKKLILATAVTAAVVVYFVGDNNKPVEDNTVMQNLAEQTNSMVESTNAPVAQVAVSDKQAVNDNDMPSSNSDDQGYSSYNQDYNALENERVSNPGYSRYSGESDSYNDDYNSSPNSDSSSEDYSSSDSSSSYSSENSDDSNTNNNEDSADTKDTDKEELPTEKFQRIYDNGIVWYGDYGTLNIQYQSSNAATTGIGFRLHYNSSSMKVTNINQYSDGALVMTRPEAAQNDTNNKDNNDATDAYLTFAWFEMSGQWPQATQVNLATIEFERLNNDSNDYSIDYSVTSNSAGYQFVK
jgi:cobalamin biosynthesis protein CobT